MKKIIFFILILLSTANAYAAPAVSSEELFKEAEKYDGETVIYKGEVIGDIMVREGFAWLNVRDKSDAIGVFCPKDMAGGIKYKGGYGFTGDTVSVWGVFHRSCPEHGGDTDIHAEKIIIIQEGQAIYHPLEAGKVKASIILPAIALGLAIIYLIVRRFR
ncbi:MAG: DNA-binding protein [Candidatus Omnitrophica bacterium]|nr:DNA-binding protein [Candidatus Omnitrophota bacterium]